MPSSRGTCVAQAREAPAADLPAGAEQFQHIDRVVKVQDDTIEPRFKDSRSDMDPTAEGLMPLTQEEQTDGQEDRNNASGTGRKTVEA
jgi:hypothetical protein